MFSSGYCIRSLAGKVHDLFISDLISCQVGRVNCRELSDQCRALHVLKFPTFMTFKESGGAEVFYGEFLVLSITDNVEK